MTDIVIQSVTAETRDDGDILVSRTDNSKVWELNFVYCLQRSTRPTGFVRDLQDGGTSAKYVTYRTGAPRSTQLTEDPTTGTFQPAQFGNNNLSFMSITFYWRSVYGLP